MKHDPINSDPWGALKRFTNARIAQGRCGTSVPLSENLKFKLDHARARDAVHEIFNAEGIISQMASHDVQCMHLKSSVADRQEYLTRPDKGRVLCGESRRLLNGLNKKRDIALIIGDGLSPRAVYENAPPLAAGFIKAVEDHKISMGPVFVVENARVAISDDIGSLLSAKVAVILIGERPGLSSPYSLGIYITYNPQPGTTDDGRNCISNICTNGMSVSEGIQKLAYIVESAFIEKRTGVHLKDRMAEDYIPFSRGPFLLA